MVTFSDGHGFGYSRGDQRMWKKKHEHCKGQHQSPISISSRRAIPAKIPALEFIYYHNLLPGPLKVHNNGHSGEDELLESHQNPKSSFFKIVPLTYKHESNPKFFISYLH